MDDRPEPALEGDALDEAFANRLAEAAALGLTLIAEAGMSDWSHWDALVRLRRAGRLPLRVRVFVASGAADLDRMDAARGESDAGLSLEGVKFYADGWLGPRTCACSQPFHDRPGDDGVLFLDAGALAQRAEPFVEAGWRIATHAIGDRAIDAVLGAYRSLFGADAREPAPRIEHAQLLRPDLIDRMASLGAVACIQPCFGASDAGALAAAHDGDFPDAYRWDRLLAAGVRVITGSDFPIETLDPVIGLERLCSGPHPLDRATALELLTADDPGVRQR